MAKTIRNMNDLSAAFMPMLNFVQVVYASGIMIYLSFRLFTKVIAAGYFAALINSANQLSSSLKRASGSQTL